MVPFELPGMMSWSSWVCLAWVDGSFNNFQYLWSPKSLFERGTGTQNFSFKKISISGYPTFPWMLFAIVWGMSINLSNFFNSSEYLQVISLIFLLSNITTFQIQTYWLVIFLHHLMIVFTEICISKESFIAIVIHLKGF